MSGITGMTVKLTMRRRMMHKCMCFEVGDNYIELCDVCKEALSRLNTKSIRTVWMEENDE